MAAYALGQLIFGPVADAYGRRKRVLAFGASRLHDRLPAVARRAQNLETFVLARCLQGLRDRDHQPAAAKAIITDSFASKAHARVYVHVDRVGLAPIVAPVIGAHLQEWFGWRACLVFLLVYSLVMWALLWRYRETLPKPVHLEPRTLMTNAGKVLAAAVFQSCFRAQGLCYSILLVFNIVGPFMVQTTLHSRRPSSAISRSGSG